MTAVTVSNARTFHIRKEPDDKVTFILGTNNLTVGGTFTRMDMMLLKNLIETDLAP